MEFEVWGQTDVGLKREINQDSILIDKDLNLFIVADGMGGHKGGEVASALAVETVRETVENWTKSQQKINPRDLVVHSYRESSAKIHHKSTVENPELMGMGTTMVLAYYTKGRMFIGNVGDSRAYLFAENELWQLTEDHSLVNEQVKAGVISEEESMHISGRNVITRSVGFEREVQVDILEREVNKGDMILLCSDGLSGLVSAADIADICRRVPKPNIVKKCIEMAKEAGGDDNISVVLIDAKG